jgi:hypothetical protein
MLDMVRGPQGPNDMNRYPTGSYPVVVALDGL